MAVTAIDATAGGASANSFATQAEVDTYMDNRLNATAWTGATGNDPVIAMHEAMRELRYLDYMGKRTDTTQALPFPREEVVNPDLPATEDPLNADPLLTYYANTVVPQRMKDAQAELALEFLRAGTVDVAAPDGNRNKASSNVGPLATEFVDVHQRLAGLSKYLRVVSLISPLLDPDAGTLEVSRV